LDEITASRPGLTDFAHFIAIGAISARANLWAQYITMSSTIGRNRQPFEVVHLAGVAAPAISSYLLNTHCTFA
jgi:hypothetical protein